MSTTNSHSDAASELRAAHERLERLRSELDSEGIDREDLESIAEAHRAVETVLERWEERATDWDDFQGYVEFRNDFAETLDSIPDDIPESDAFLEADSHVKTGGVSKSLTAKDFEAARDALEPARTHRERLTELREAREEYRDALRAARKRRNELEARIEDFERLVRLSGADINAPVETLQEPITRYNEAVREEFDAFRRRADARTFLSFVETAAAAPLVNYETPPPELLEYVHERSAGEHTVGELLEYAEYSPSKLSHYVDDADLLKRRIATNRTYLERLSAEPLCIEWPPAEAEQLRFRTRELVSLVGRFADDETVTALREVRALTRQEEYDRLRTAADARAGLTDTERERIESGDLKADLAAVREKYQRLEEALDDCDSETK